MRGRSAPPTSGGSTRSSRAALLSGRSCSPASAAIPLEAPPRPIERCFEGAPCAASTLAEPSHPLTALEHELHSRDHQADIARGGCEKLVDSTERVTIAPAEESWRNDAEPDLVAHDYPSTPNTHAGIGDH